MLEVQPLDHFKCVSIVECDMQLEFAAPVGYKEPTRMPVAAEAVRQITPVACIPLPTFAPCTFAQTLTTHAVV